MERELEEMSSPSEAQRPFVAMVAAFRLGDLEEVASNARQADSLRRGSTSSVVGIPFK